MGEGVHIPWIIALVGACGSQYDLPTEWSGADRIDVSQGVCAGSVDMYPPDPIVSALPLGHSIEVTYDNASFRCQQQVEGFVQDQGMLHHVLIQPKDMHPRTVALCDCLYRLNFRISASAGVNQVAVYQRRDTLGGPGDVLKVAVVNVDMP